MKYVNLGCGNRFHPDWINIDIASTGPGVLAHDISQGLPLASNSCDVVYHSHVLEHLRRRDVPKFLAECFRVLSPGGIIRVAVPDLEQICRIYLRKLEGALQGDPQSTKDYEWMMLELYDQTVREHGHSEMWIALNERGMSKDPFVRSRIGDLHQQAGSAHPRKEGMFKQFARFFLKHLLWFKQVRSWKIGRFRLAGEVHQWMYDRFSLGQVLLTAGFQNPTKQQAETSLIPGWAQFNLDTLPDGTSYKPDSLYMEAIKPKTTP
jgi:predicted SAM-dependent methyltransferase